MEDSLGRTSKVCTGPCARELPISAFRANKRYTGGFTSQCLECYAAYRRAHPPSPESSRRRSIKHRYGLSEETVADMWMLQGGGCAICHRSLVLTGECADRIYIDHDHACCPGLRSCGKCLRGILCFLCNTGLGKFDDDQERLERAVQYLAFHKERLAS